MKKKLLAIFTVACVACLSLVLMAGCSSSNKSSSSSSSSTPDKVIVGFDEGYPPFGYIDEATGEHTGFDIDLAKEAANRLGWTVEFQPIDWDSKESLIESGTITCIWNGFTIEGREDQYAFSEPYFQNVQVVLTREDTGINKLSDLADKIVLAQTNSAAYELLAEGGDQAELAKTFKSLETIPQYNTALMQLESGAVDAIAIDEPVAKQLIEGKQGYKILDETLRTEHYGVGFKKGEDAMAQQITDTLKEMYNDGTVEKIAANYEAIDMGNWVLK